MHAAHASATRVTGDAKVRYPSQLCLANLPYILESLRTRILPCEPCKISRPCIFTSTVEMSYEQSMIQNKSKSNRGLTLPEYTGAIDLLIVYPEPGDPEPMEVDAAAAGASQSSTAKCGSPHSRISQADIDKAKGTRAIVKKIYPSQYMNGVSQMSCCPCIMGASKRAA